MAETTTKPPIPWNHLTSAIKKLKDFAETIPVNHEVTLPGMPKISAYNYITNMTNLMTLIEQKQDIKNYFNL